MSNIKYVHSTALILYIFCVILSVYEGKYYESMIWFNCAIWCFIGLIPDRTRTAKKTSDNDGYILDQDD